MIGIYIKPIDKVVVVDVNVNGVLRSYLLPREYVKGLHIGDELELESVDEFVEYSIDWSMLFDELKITPTDIQNTMMRHGIRTVSDYVSKSKVVYDALNWLIMDMRSDLSQLVLEVERDV